MISSYINCNIGSYYHNNIFFHGFFKHSSSLEQNLKHIADDNMLEWNDERQKTVLDALRQHYPRYIKHIKKICNRLTDGELHHLIQSAARLSLEPLSAMAKNKPIERLTDLLTLEQIEAAMRTEFPHFTNALEKAKELSQSAKYYLDLVHPPTAKPALNKLLTNLIWTIDNIIDGILSTMGVNEFQDDDANEYKATYRLQLLLSAFSALSALVTIAVSLTGSAILALSIVAMTVIIGGALIALYLNFIKPAPRRIKGCRNLTSEAISGGFSLVDGRQHYFDEIAESLIASSGHAKAHPLLIGPSGVGKTEIFHGFARAVADGRYPALAGKQIFYINTADFTPSAPGSRTESPSLEKIKDRIRYHKDDVILIFDEIHESCKQGKNGGNLAERLKTLLDPGPDGFPFVIGATTTKEFCTYIEPNDPLARRFKHITITETSKMQTLAILKKNLLMHPGIYVAEDAIGAIYELSHKYFPERPQPYMSCRILAHAIVKAQESGASKVQLQIEEEQAAIETYISSRLLGQGTDFLYGNGDRQADDEYRLCMKRLDSLKKQLKEEIDHSRALETIIHDLEQAKEKTLEISLKIVKQGGKANLRHCKELTLTSYQIQALNDALHAISTNIGKRFPYIDVNLVQEVIDHEHSLVVNTIAKAERVE